MNRKDFDMSWEKAPHGHPLFQAPALIRIAAVNTGTTRMKSRARSRREQWLLTEALSFPQWWQEKCHGPSRTRSHGAKERLLGGWGRRVGTQRFAVWKL